jgi:Zn-dependent protease with chaperone function
MLRNRWMAVVCLLLIATTASSCTPQYEPESPEEPGRDLAFEQEIYDRLAAINSDAVPIFQEATEAVDAGDLEAARRGYERVLELAPDFPDALRRLSYVEWQSGNVGDALDHANRALAIQDSPYNEIAMVYPLLMTGEPAAIGMALGYAHRAVAALPDDEDANVALMYAGIAAENRDAIRRATDKLLEIGSDNAEAHYQAGLLAAEEEEWERAERELLLARELGKPAGVVQQALDNRIAGQSRLYRWLRVGAYTIATWLAGLAVFFPLGELLSRLTLRAIERDAVVGRIPRALYSVVTAFASLWFYISIGALVLIMVELTVVSFQIVVGLGVLFMLLVLYTLATLARSTLVWIREERPRRPLARDEAPRLWALVEDVARRVGARPVDAIYITPAPSIAVVERGNALRKLLGPGRCDLYLGFGVLPDMTQGQFKAVLAQRYGHFAARHAVGNSFVWHVRRLMERMVGWLEETKWLNRYNLVWLFLHAFSRGFLRVTLGVSYLREVLADRCAVEACGVQEFVDGLTHLVYQSLVFEMRLGHEMELQVDMRPRQQIKFKAGEGWREMENFYDHPPLSGLLLEQLQMRVDEAMSRPASPCDGLPVPQERIRLARQLEPLASTAANREPVWDLLPKVEALQKEMTDALQAVMQRRVQDSHLSARRRLHDWW